MVLIQMFGWECYASLPKVGRPLALPTENRLYSMEGTLYVRTSSASCIELRSSVPKRWTHSFTIRLISGLRLMLRWINRDISKRRTVRFPFFSIHVLVSMKLMDMECIGGMVSTTW